MPTNPSPYAALSSICFIPMTALSTIANYSSKIYFLLFKNSPINAAIKAKKLFLSVLTSPSLSTVSIWVTANSKPTSATKPLRKTDGVKLPKTTLKPLENTMRSLTKTPTSAMPKKNATAETSWKSLRERFTLPPPTLPKPTLSARSINSLMKL